MLCPDIKLQKKPQQNSTRYRTALYLRLSREDGDKTESDSIANQRTLLEAYAADQPRCMGQAHLQQKFRIREIRGQWGLCFDVLFTQTSS